MGPGADPHSIHGSAVPSWVPAHSQIRNVLIINHAGLVMFVKQFNDDIQQVGVGSVK